MIGVKLKRGRSSPLLLLIVFMATLFLFLISCNRSGADPEVHIIVPEGFKGDFALAESSNAPPPGKDGEGGFVYRIDGPGITEFSNLEPLSGWYVLDASFENGKYIPNGATAAGYSGDTMVIISKYVDEKERRYFSLQKLRSIE